MFTLKSAFILSALALSVVRAQDTLALSWNSTSPFGQSKGIFDLVDSNFGEAMVFADGSTSQISAHYDTAQGTVVQDCPHAGLTAALIPVEGSSPAAFSIQWVNSSVTLPEGAFTQSLVPATGGFVSTLRSDGIFKQVNIDGTFVFAWVNETWIENGDVQSWFVTTEGSTITC